MFYKQLISICDFPNILGIGPLWLQAMSIFLHLLSVSYHLINCVIKGAKSKYKRKQSFRFKMKEKLIYFWFSIQQTANSIDSYTNVRLTTTADFISHTQLCVWQCTTGRSEYLQPLHDCLLLQSSVWQHHIVPVFTSLHRLKHSVV